MKIKYSKKKDFFVGHTKILYKWNYSANLQDTTMCNCLTNIYVSRGNNQNWQNNNNNNSIWMHYKKNFILTFLGWLENALSMSSNFQFLISHFNVVFCVLLVIAYFQPLLLLLLQSVRFTCMLFHSIENAWWHFRGCCGCWCWLVLWCICNCLCFVTVLMWLVVLLMLMRCG